MMGKTFLSVCDEGAPFFSVKSIRFSIVCMRCLGVESTAHTFGIGIAEDRKIIANARSAYKPKTGGIHPLEAAQHHREAQQPVLDAALSEAGIALSDIDVFSYSAGPGLPPCLKVGAEFTKAAAAAKPIMEVNHCIAHIEIGRLLTHCNDPVVIYVSGGNTQIISHAAGRYRVFGETQDIAVGNLLDTFIRKTIDEFPGGPVFDRLAQHGRYIELPYVVKGMDLSFSGILTAALQKYAQRKQLGITLEDICYSIQETAYAMLVEVTERALAHSGKSEVLCTGGVAASPRLQRMLQVMCEERGARAYACPADYARDNGAMIAWAGLLAYNAGQKPVAEPDFNPRWRTDAVEALWLR